MRSKGYSGCPVCMCVHLNLPPHTLESQKRYQRVHSNAGIVLNFADFPKNALLKSYGIICLYTSSICSSGILEFFPERNKLLC